MAYTTTEIWAQDLTAKYDARIDRVEIACGPIAFCMTPHEAAELVRQIAIALEAASEAEAAGYIERMPPITPPVSLREVA